MISRLIIFVVMCVPLGLLGQSNVDSVENTKEIYTIIQTVIKKEKLDRKYGLQLQPEPNCTCMYDDTTYLKKFLMKPEDDTIPESQNNYSPFFVSPGADSSIRKPLLYDLSFLRSDSIVIGQERFLSEADMNYMIDSKQKFKNFTWNNDLLRFNLKNKKDYYVFSLPHFNLAHDRAIVMCESRCPGLCGLGQTLLLSKTDKGWEVSPLDVWMH